MEYDEIDDFVDQLFDKPDGGDKPEITLSGDWRIDRIDQIIQDTYDEAIWWHNQRISEGTDPRSGLRSLPYIPWDEETDGVAAMMGAGGGESSLQRNGYPQVSTRTVPQAKRQSDGGFILVSLLLAVLACIGCGLLAYIADWISLYG